MIAKTKKKTGVAANKHLALVKMILILRIMKMPFVEDTSMLYGNFLY